MSGCSGDRLFTHLLPPCEPHEEERHEDRRDERRREHAAHDACSHRSACSRSCAGCDRERQHAEHERERGHHDRPEAQPRRLHRRVDRAHALEQSLLRELDDQNRILRCKPDQHHEADLKVDVVLHPAQPDEEQRAGHGERHREHHRAWQPPPLVQRREDEIDHHDREAEREERSAAGSLLLKRLSGPRDGVARRENLRCRLFDRRDRLAGAHAGFAAAEHLRGEEAVVALDLLGTDDAGSANQRFQRNHFTGRVRAHVNLPDVIGLCAVRRVSLHLNAIRAPRHVEVVHVERPHRALKRIEDVGHGNAERHRLLAIDFDEELRHGRAKNVLMPWRSGCLPSAAVNA